MKTLAVVLVCLFPITDGLAQVVRGRTTAANSNVSAVAVSLINHRGQAIAQAISDSTGSFSLNAPRAGTYQLRASRLGYAQFNSERVEVKADDGSGRAESPGHHGAATGTRSSGRIRETASPLGQWILPHAR
jgi:hypothetical protein